MQHFQRNPVKNVFTTSNWISVRQAAHFVIQPSEQPGPMRVLSPKLLEVLRGSLQRVQSAIDLDPSDSALRGLKSSIVRSIAELEIKKSRAEARTQGRRVRVIQIIPRPEQPADSPEPGGLVQPENDAA